MVKFCQETTKEKKMKCIKCDCKTDLLTTDGKAICPSCAEKEGLVVCSDLGKVIADKNFQCDRICNDCIYKEDNN